MPVILSKFEVMSLSVLLSQNWKEPKHLVFIFVVLEYVLLV